MKKNFKTIYLLVIAILTVVCIIIGLCVHTGMRRFGINMGDTIEYDQDVDAFTSIVLDTDAADVNLIYGDTYHVYYRYDENYAPTVEVKDNTLYIEETGGSTATIGVDFDDEDYKIEITVPEGTDLEKFECNADMGNIEFSDASVKSVFVEADYGNVELSNCTFSDVSITADLGNVEFDAVTFDTGSFSADEGNISLQNGTFTSAQCEADLGNIEVNGTFDALQAETSMGNITVDTDRDVNELQLDLNTDLGNVTVNGVEQNGFHSESGTNHAESDDSHGIEDED